jgi:hypothetical protein
MSKTASLDDLLTEMFGVEDVEIPGKGVVQVRPLSRAQVLAIQGQELPAAELEQRLLSQALVSPKVTAAQVKAWQEKSPAGEIEPVAEAVMRLSGMKADSAKEAVKTFRDEPGA